MPSSSRSTRAKSKSDKGAVGTPSSSDASATGEVKPAKAKKQKLVRDSFTMPEAEYATLAVLKNRCLAMGFSAKKSELLRAAVACLDRLSDEELASSVRSLAVIKTGRPAKSGK
jgi:hypothetical protein